MYGRIPCRLIHPTDKAYTAFDKKNNSAALSLDFNPTLSYHDKDGISQAEAHYEGGGIEFGPGAEANKIAHEIGHDIGFGDQYLQNKEDGYALPLVESFNTMMGTLDALAEKEAQKIANAVDEQHITDAVIQPIDINKDLPKPGSTVDVYTGKGSDKQAKKANVSSGKFGSFKTRQGEVIK